MVKKKSIQILISNKSFALTQSIPNWFKFFFIILLFIVYRNTYVFSKILKYIFPISLWKIGKICFWSTAESISISLIHLLHFLFFFFFYPPYQFFTFFYFLFFPESIYKIYISQSPLPFSPSTFYIFYKVRAYRLFSERVVWWSILKFDGVASACGVYVFFFVFFSPL